MTPTARPSSVRFPSAGKPATPWLLAAGLLILLLILATLQYRWLDEVSQADRAKSRELLQTAVSRFAEDFDRELTRAFLYLQPPPAMSAAPLQEDPRGSGEGFVQRYERWQAYAPFPDLVRDVFMVRRGEDGAFEATRFAPGEGVFEPVPWPAELEPLELRLAAERRGPRRRGGPGGVRLLADEVPALILPVSGGHTPGGGPPGRRPGEPPFFRGLMIVRLDLETIRDVILPELSRRHLHGGGREPVEYEASVFALRDQRIIFRRGASPEEASSPPRGADGPIPDGDAAAGLFGLLPPDKLGALELEAGLGVAPQARDPDRGSELEAPGDRPRGRRFRDGHLQRLYRFVSAEENARWRLVASHPAGSLDAAASRAHRRNLVMSFGILLLLGASLLLMLVSTRRIQALARQQLEFVAGVTHELLTPLAAMRSAGQNLADGVVAEPRQVRRYGRLVEDEGRRLSTMVEQVLEFAGMQAGGRSYTLERTRAAPVVDSALAEYSRVLDEQGVRVDKRLDDDLPEIMADAPALRRAVQNLIANAIKYAAQGAWIGVRAVTGDGPGGPELRISVEDRGPGIATAEVPRLFEPFYRGRNASTEAVPGSGLGLSLVKHIALGHGGRVTVASREGEGSTFTLHLPAAGDPTRNEENDEL